MDQEHKGSKTEIVVGEIRRAHLEQVVALFAAQGWSGYSGDPERTWRALTAPGTVCVLATAGNRVVGVAHVLSDGEIQAFLAILVVADAFRREGIGRRLVHVAFELSQAQRIDLISCADEFYESLAFRRLPGFRMSREEVDSQTAGPG